ncbi:Chorismate dehydratase [Planctomycetes bacterium Pan216]|uniref:Chorismate dehydratase n=1 Tax=Kolteria novifilia TaxID=2527975 RepID=A0A518AY30_9BACT|nr:Chorismate dehydratase [Planctomycetes bacterium Pan216]
MLRAGAVSYLNTKPLVCQFDRIAPDVELSLEVPSRLATELAEGRLDVALIPSIEFFRAGNYTILPDVSIASYGPVMSVKLCSRVPFEEIETVALDEGSRTSIALMTILLDELFDVVPLTSPLPLDATLGESGTDAVLVIGDRAMNVLNDQYPYILDLGYEWSRWTGLPFVFAFWAVAPGVEVTPSQRQAFIEAKEFGRTQVPAIASEEAKRLGIDEIQCLYYLQHVIRHDFGPEEQQGLTRFYELACQHGLAPKGVPFVFQGQPTVAQGC